MSRAEFSIVYDGPALHDGTMDVRDLAPALLAVGQFFEAANETLNGDRASVKVNVVATKDGSFEVLLGLDQSLIAQAVELLTSETVTAAINLKELLIGGAGVAGSAAAGLIAYLKWLKRRKPDKLETLKDGRTRVTIEGDTLEVANAVLRLAADDNVRRALHKLIAEPLEQDGIDHFCATDNRNSAVVEEQEAEYFKREENDDQPLLDETRKVAVSIRSLAFAEGNKWRLDDGTSRFLATIEDGSFLSRVENSDVAFSKGDILICEVRTRQYQEGLKLKSVHTVEKVLEHRRAAKQLRLDLKSSDGNSNNDLA